MTDDDRLSALSAALRRHTPRTGPVEPDLGEAAVLLMVRPTQPLELLLIRRAEKESDPWSGHMALPGGRREPTDPDLLATALRETEEETGIVVPRDRVLGPLDQLRPTARRRFRLVIAPFVATVPEDTRAVPDPSEVDEAIWVPLQHLASDDAVDEVLIELEEGSFRLPALNYQDYVVWGMTHRILTGFMDIARAAGLV